MNILFISDSARNYSAGGFEPLGILYLSGSLRQAGHRVAMCGAEGREIAKQMSEFRPRVVAYSATTGSHELYLGLNRTLKRKYDFISVVGGPHPTFFPLVIEEQGVDAICIGEGERAFVEFAERLDKKEDIATTRNFHVKSEGEIRRNMLRPLEEYLDSIPCPDRGMYYSKYKFAGASKMKTFIASRGCPYRCTYCFNHLYKKLYGGKGRLIRFRSPGNVVEEVARVKERYPLEMAVFHDSSFLFDTDWLREFSRLFRKEIGIPFNCSARADHVTEEKVAALKEGGCFSLVWAMEAGNDHVRNDILKRDMPREAMLRASRLLRKYGIRSGILNMLGAPGESLSECLETLDFTIRCRPDFTMASLLHPYPGTEIYETARKMGFLPGAKIRFRETYYLRSPLNLPDKRKIENLQKLFSVIVALPRLRRLAPVLVTMPLGGMYNLIRRIHKGFCLRYRIFHYRISPKEYCLLAWRFLTSKAG